MAQTAHDTAMLLEAWRRAVLALFVRESWLEEDAVELPPGQLRTPPPASPTAAASRKNEAEA